MFGQVVLAEETVKAKHPGVFHRLCKDPHMRGTPNVILTVDKQGVPLHEPLEIYVVANWQRSLHTSKWAVKEEL